MKRTRFISVFTVAALMLSAVPLVHAAEHTTSEQSAFEGQTITCQVVDVTAEGVTTSSVDVVIPEGATKNQEDALVYAAIGEENSANTLARAEGNHPDFLAEIQNPDIQDLPGTCLYSGNLPRTYQRILVDVSVQQITGVSNLYVQYRNTSVGSYSGWIKLNFNKYPQRVIFRYAEGYIMEKGNHAEVWVYANPGKITASYAQVVGSPISD